VIAAAGLRALAAARLRVIAAARLLVCAAALLASGCGGLERPSASTGTPTATAATALRGLAFLEGTWRAQIGDATTEEVWTAVSGGTVVGIGRVVSGERTLFFEWMFIASSGDEVVLWAFPRGGEPVPFRLVEQHEGDVVFANPGHDFPKRMRYRSEEGGAVLFARVEGDDPADAEEFRWQRVAAPSAEVSAPATSAASVSAPTTP
jgi:hypothetical protein